MITKQQQPRMTLLGSSNTRGNYREAERLLNRALAARVKLLGEEHSATARTMRSLGCVYRCLGRPDDAIKLFIRSSEIIKKRYGAESLPMASALVLLARHWRRDGKKYKLSCRLCRKVLIIRDAKLGPHHPATAVALGLRCGNRARAGISGIPRRVCLLQRGIWKEVDH